MTTSTNRRINVLGSPLVEAEIELLDGNGRNLLPTCSGALLSVDNGIGSSSFSFSMWSKLRQRDDGLFDASVDGIWHPPVATIEVTSPVATLERLLNFDHSAVDRMDFTREHAPLVRARLGHNWDPESNEGWPQYAGKSLAIARELKSGLLELTLTSPSLVQTNLDRTDVPPAASLKVCFSLSRFELAGLGILSAMPFAAGRDGSDVVASNWRPDQSSVADLATDGCAIAARGTLDWHDQARHRAPTGPWVRCHMRGDHMTLIPIERVDRQENGFARYSRTEGEMQLNIGKRQIETIMQGRETARVDWKGAGIGHIDAVTTWPMETGGPQTQLIEWLSLVFEKSEAGLRLTGTGMLGEGGSLGPALDFDLVLPQVWLAMHRVRL